MKKLKLNFLLAIIGAISLVSCNPEAKTEEDREQKLIGEVQKSYIALRQSGATPEDAIDKIAALSRRDPTWVKQFIN